MVKLVNEDVKFLFLNFIGHIKKKLYVKNRKLRFTIYDCAPVVRYEGFRLYILCTYLGLNPGEFLLGIYNKYEAYYNGLRRRMQHTSNARPHLLKLK
jgi:hypothetical protein